jgi:hypothetical protein
LGIPNLHLPRDVGTLNVIPGETTGSQAFAVRAEGHAGATALEGKEFPDERIGFARSPFELYEKCFRLGFKEEEFVVRLIMEEIAPGTACTPLWDA